MSQDPISAGHLGRSQLRRIGLEHNHRKRPYLLRYLVVTAALALLGGLVLATVTEAFPPEGPFQAAYWIHDNLWLWAKGHLWTAMFPWSLLFLVPLVVILLILAIEYLTPFGILELQRRVIKFRFHMFNGRYTRLPPPEPGILRQRLAMPTLSHMSFEGRLMLRIAVEQWQSRWLQCREKRLHEPPVEPARLVQLETAVSAWLRADASDVRAYLAWLETAALLPGAPGQQSASQLQSYLAAIDLPGEPALETLREAASLIAQTSTLEEREGRLYERISKLQNRSPDSANPIGLAAEIVVAGAFSSGPLGRIWMEALNTRLLAEALRQGSNETRVAIALVDHELWAWTAEDTSQVPEPKGILVGFGQAPDRGENFAVKGIS